MFSFTLNQTNGFPEWYKGGLHNRGLLDIFFITWVSLINCAQIKSMLNYNSISEVQLQKRFGIFYYVNGFN